MSHRFTLADSAAARELFTRTHRLKLEVMKFSGELSVTYELRGSLDLVENGQLNLKDRQLFVELLSAFIQTEGPADELETGGEQ